MEAKLVYEAAKLGQIDLSADQLSFLDNDGLSAIHYAALDGNGAALNNLIMAGVDRDVLSRERETAFDLAIDAGHFDLAKILLGDRSLADPRPNGYNALDLVAMSGQTEAARFLVSLGANVNGAANMRAPITWAVQENQLEMTKLLIHLGADILKVGDETIDPNDALSLAVGDGNFKITALFVEHLKKTRSIDSQRLNQVLALGVAYDEKKCVELLQQLQS